MSSDIAYKGLVIYVLILLIFFLGCVNVLIDIYYEINIFDIFFLCINFQNKIFLTLKIFKCSLKSIYLHRFGDFLMYKIF